MSNIDDICHDKRDCSCTEEGQLYEVTTPSFGYQPISEGKSWIPTNQIYGIQKDRYPLIAHILFNYSLSRYDCSDLSL